MLSRIVLVLLSSNVFVEVHISLHKPLFQRKKLFGCLYGGECIGGTAKFIEYTVYIQQ